MPSGAMAVEFDEKKIDAIFRAFDRSDAPGAAVGIALAGRPLYRKGFGLASLDLPVTLSPQIRMRIYSTTKHFTCLAYMLLCEEGRAGVDDPIGKHLPELHPVVRRVTMRQLMNNMSGIRDACDIRWLFSGTERAVTAEELVALYRDTDDINFPAGTAWSYNNGGFQLLSAAIERITGKSFEEALRRILDRVGMYDTLLRRYDTDFLPNSASMHMTHPSGGFHRAYLTGALVGEGGMVSTVDDMLRWLAHMDAPVVGSASTWTLMRSSGVLANGTQTGYGLGLALGRYRGVDTVYHGGYGWGCNSQMLKVPAAKLDVVVMVNRHDAVAMLLTDEILDTCLVGLEPVRRSRVPAVTGVFQSPRTGRIVQLHSSGTEAWNGDGQQIVSVDGMDMPAEPDEKGLLRPIRPMAHMKIAVRTVGDPRHPTSIQLHDFGNVDELVRKAGPAGGSRDAILGRYRSDATGTLATVARTNEEVSLTTLGRFGTRTFALECIAEGIWRFPGCVVAFENDGQSFRLSDGGTRGLPFRRCA